MKRKATSRTILTLLLTVSLTFNLIPLARAQSTAISVINPATGDNNFVFFTNSTEVGFRFNVTVWVEDVVDLMAFQVHLLVNDTLLDITRAWLPTWDPQYVFYGMPTIVPAPLFFDDDGDGSREAVWVGDAIISGPAFSGDGLLAIIELEILYAPSTGKVSDTLNIESVNTYLLDSNIEEIPHSRMSGYYEYSYASFTGPIYIRTDGSIEPLTAPIQREVDIYTLTSNIPIDTQGIIIERNNMTLDGAGYTVQGTGVYYYDGIRLSARSNVTIKNIEIKGFYYGISLFNSANNSISGNNITANTDIGVCLDSSTNNNVTRNNITASSSDGIHLYASSHNRLSENNITNNRDGIHLECSMNNTISRNNITGNVHYGIDLWSSNNFVYHNNFISNNIQACAHDSVNTWDEGYPSGGNYWSDYTGVDDFSGPNQDQPNSDGIGDTPNVIEENNRDRYPLMNRVTYCVTIKAHCNTEGLDVNVDIISMDGWSTSYTMPHTFGLTGIHTFTVPSSDLSGHPFTQWNTGEPSTTITVSSGGTYTAYYDVTPPYAVTLRANCLTEGGGVSVSITMDGSPTGFSTPHTFNGLTGIHTFTVPGSDLSGHAFAQWNTGEPSTTITVSSGGTYTAYYGISTVPDQYIYTIATIGGPKTLDPHWAYDTASDFIIMNVYETLIEFKRSYADDFIKELADSWTISPDGLTYTFHIRTGVKFSDGSTLSPADVEYSFERGMVRDPAGGPMWMHYEPLIGVYESRLYPGWTTPSGIEELGHAIDNAITRDDVAGTVTFHLVKPYLPYMQILAQTWSSIISKSWMTRQVAFPGGATDYFDWPGWSVTGYGEGWRQYNDYSREKQSNYFGYKATPVDDPPQMMGTGPFKFVEWVKGEGGHRTLSRNKLYWGGWPAGAPGTARYGDFPQSRGYIDIFIEYQIGYWTTRKLGLLAGTYDSVYVPRANIGEVWQQAGIRCRYPMESLAVDALFFNFNIADGMAGQSPYVGDEQWGTGLPLNAFSDINMRKAFTYSFNFAAYVAGEWLDEASQMASPIIPGLAPYDKAVLQAWHAANKPEIDLNKATYYFKLAWGGVDARSGVPGKAVLPEDPAQVTPGVVWISGFTFAYVYNIGNLPRWTEGTMLSSQLLLLNPLFNMQVVGLEWATMLDEIWWEPTNYRSIIPLFGCGWQADYADAHNFAFSFMHTNGYFSFAQSYSNATVDTLIEDGMATTDPAERIAIYDKLNTMFLQEQIDIMKVEPLVRRWERDWVQGWYYNPLSTGSAAVEIGEAVYSNLYTVWKENLPWEDVDSNGKVEIKDLSVAAMAFGSYFIQPALPPPQVGPPGYYTKNWDSRCDINQDKKVDIKDLAKIARLYGYMAPPWIPPP